jgi:putative FmdB family regulatory protein
MPTYEYLCKSCGHLFEIVRSMRDDPLTECPQCGGELRKVFAPPAIAFKGSGFYATDHGKKSTKHSEQGGGDGSGERSDEIAAKKDGDAGSSGSPQEGKQPEKKPEKKKEKGDSSGSSSGSASGSSKEKSST